MPADNSEINENNEPTPAEAGEREANFVLDYATEEAEEQSSLLSFWLAWSCAICWMLGAVGAWTSFPPVVFAVSLLIVVVIAFANLIVGIAERDGISIGVAIINLAIAVSCIAALESPRTMNPEVGVRVVSLLSAGIVVPLTYKLMPTIKE